MADKLRYYILREAGKVMVPLVPADQLPVQLEGFPRELSHRQMSAEGWKFVTETNEQATILSSLPSQQTMSHHFPASPSKSSKFLAPDHTARTNADDIVREFISSAGPLPFSKSGGHHDLFGRSETETHAPARSVSAHRTFSAPTPRVFGSSDLRFAKFVQPDREFGAPSSPPIAAPKKAAQDARRSFNNTVQKHPLVSITNSSITRCRSHPIVSPSDHGVHLPTRRPTHRLQDSSTLRHRARPNKERILQPLDQKWRVCIHGCGLQIQARDAARREATRARFPRRAPVVQGEVGHREQGPDLDATTHEAAQRE